MGSLRRCLSLLSLFVSALPALAQARFDLTGPKIDIHVTRSGVTLPIASVPNLLPGDQIWLHPDFPANQSAHYLLIAVFLRGTTNPPPDDWFHRIDTWKKEVREEGVTITVPPEAEQAVLFLAPETGGDFPTLRSAVKGRPGVFVRASQDLAEAGFEQARIEKYLAEMKKVPAGDAPALAEHSSLLSRTLQLKPNPDCFKRPLDTQYSCLTQTGTQTLLDDGHGQTLTAALANGPSSDFINAASYTNLAGGGTYSAYVGAIVDLVRLTSGLHTAQYQYIPAIAFPDSTFSATETLNLRLNTPPSFHNPKSVLVIGLPAVQKAVLPPLRPAEPNHISCLLDPKMVLPIEGAPLVFSTSYAHGMVLHLNTAAGSGPQDLPLLADAYSGGLALDPNPSPRKELLIAKPTAPLSRPVPRLGSRDSAAAPATSPAPNVPTAPKSADKAAATPAPGAPITGTITGFWGFDPFVGPTLPLQHDPGTGWHILTAPDTPSILIAGKPNHLKLTSTGTACIRSIELEPSEPRSEGNTKVEWKLETPPPPPNATVTTPPATTPAATTPPATAPAASTPAALPSGSAAAPAPGLAVPTPPPVDLTLNLQHTATPGSVRLAILQFGKAEPEQVGTRTFAEPAKIESLQIHAGDAVAMLTGNSLGQVKTLTLPFAGHELTFTPKAAAGEHTLTMALATEPKLPNLKWNDHLSGEVHLEDGRSLPVTTQVLPPRPALTLLTRRITHPVLKPDQPAPPPNPIQLASADDLPLGAQLTFFLKSKTSFPRDEKVEIASEDESLHTTLTVADGGLVLQDSHTVLANFDPLKTFGPSTFGPFRMRALAPDGTSGEWLPLATIVRLPELTGLHCPADPNQFCQLSGSALYLIDSVALDPAFTSPVPVPEGFVDATLAMPHPASIAPAPSFYLKLRDDTSAIDAVMLPVAYDAPPAPRNSQNRKAPGPRPSTPPATTEQVLPPTGQP